MRGEGGGGGGWRGRERERERRDRNPVSMIAIDWNRGEGEYRSYTAPASPPMTGRTSSRSVVPDDFEGRVLHSVEFFLFFFFFLARKLWWCIYVRYLRYVIVSL